MVSSAVMVESTVVCTGANDGKASPATIATLAPASALASYGAPVEPQRMIGADVRNSRDKGQDPCQETSSPSPTVDDCSSRGSANVQLKCGEAGGGSLDDEASYRKLMAEHYIIAARPSSTCRELMAELGIIAAQSSMAAGRPSDTGWGDLEARQWPSSMVTMVM
jgi:hypothetical protein